MIFAILFAVPIERPFPINITRRRAPHESKTCSLGDLNTVKEMDINFKYPLLYKLICKIILTDYLKPVAELNQSLFPVCQYGNVLQIASNLYLYGQPICLVRE